MMALRAGNPSILHGMIGRQLPGPGSQRAAALGDPLSSVWTVSPNLKETEGASGNNSRKIRFA